MIRYKLKIALISILVLINCNSALAAGSSLDFVVDIPWDFKNNEGIFKQGRYLVFVKEKDCYCELLFYSTNDTHGQTFSEGIPNKKPKFTTKGLCFYEFIDNSLKNPQVETLISKEGKFLIVYFETYDKKSQTTQYVITKLQRME